MSSSKRTRAKKSRLPSRPSQHILEDQSISALRNLKPSHWVIRKLSDDYGIDGEFEVFDSATTLTTGLTCLFQLKASAASRGKAIKTPLKVSTYRYMQQLMRPVLILKWIQSNSKIYWRWVHGLDPRPDQLSKATFTVPFDEDRLWTSETPSIIESDLRRIQRLDREGLHPPFVVSVTYSLSKDHTWIFSKAVAALRTSFESENIPIVLKTGLSTESMITLNATNDEIRIGITGRSGAVLDIKAADWKKPYFDLTPGKLIALLILALDSSLQAGAALGLYDAFENYLVNLSDGETKLAMTRVLLKNNRLEEAFKLARTLKSDHPQYLFQFSVLLLRYRETATNSQAAAVVRYLEENIASSPKEQLGVEHYNLANALKEGNHRNAIHHYRLAAKHDPSYKHRAYFYREIGAILFNSRHYSWAKSAYLKANDIGLDENIDDLIADCEFFSGNYKTARDLWLSYFHNSPKSNFKWAHQVYVANYLVEHLNICQQTRRRHWEKLSLQAFVDAVSLEALIDVASVSFSFDALDPYTWYNIAHKAQLSENYSLAEIGFLIAGIVNRKDVEAWTNAVLSGIKANSPAERIMAILGAGIFFCGAELSNEIRDRLHASGFQSFDNFDAMVDGLKEHYATDLSGRLRSRARIISKGRNYISYEFGAGAKPQIRRIGIRHNTKFKRRR